MYLPPSEGAKKVGLDDFFAQGGTVEELLALATPTLRPLPRTEHDEHRDCAYQVTSGGLMWNRPTRDGFEAMPLCNFCAFIESERLVSDGVQLTRVYNLRVEQRGRTWRFPVSAGAFSAMNWVSEQLGAGAHLEPGPVIREHTRVAIQKLSQNVEEVAVFSHTGWCNLSDGRAAYLHGGGALTQEGDEGAEVDLPPDLAPVHLVAPRGEEELVEAVRASLQVWRVAKEGVAIPVMLAVYRSAVGGADFGVSLSGPSGVFKSELAALAQAHFGARFSSRSLPGSWSSTENALEGLAFHAKDMVLVIDDFAPQSGFGERQKLNKKAERLFRAQGWQWAGPHERRWHASPFQTAARPDSLDGRRCAPRPFAPGAASDYRSRAGRHRCRAALKLPTRRP